MLLRIWILKGLNRYLRFAANKIDGFVVLVSWVAMLVDVLGVDLTFVRMLRVCRLIRGAKIVLRIESVACLVEAMYQSGQALLHYSLIISLTTNSLSTHRSLATDGGEHIRVYHLVNRDIRVPWDDIVRWAL